VTWYRSLYWRIAVGFIACVAILLIVQGFLFVWMMARAGSTVPNQPPDRLAQTIAVDVAQALERDAALDVERYVRQEYAADSQPFVVLLADGRVLEIGARFPEALKSEARERLNALKNVDPQRLARGGPFGRGGPFRPGDRGPMMPPDGDRPPGAPFPPRDGRAPFDPERQPAQSDGTVGPRSGRPNDRRPGGPRPMPPFQTGRPWPIVANGTLAGLVVVPPQPPFRFLLTRYAPTLLTVAGVTLVVGGVLAALVIFGPTRRRLKAVEDAARRLGAGDLTARAPSTGDDEVSAVASAFNAMAHDLAARTEALMNADRVRRQLLADVSHELNTPVTAMRGYLETLSMPEMRLDETTRARYLGIVADETARLERIIGDLLELARLEGGGGALKFEKFRIEELFARVAARHERTAESARIRLETVIDAGAETIEGDRTRLEQALQNLAANALRYAPAGTTVRLQARNDGTTVALLVSDEGPGIPPEHLQRVFDRFYKVDESRVAQLDAAAGSGLGLSIVKAIVERHGGQISVDSRPGRTVFEIKGLSRS
jgi:signal transduction histidine kinase